jgi:flagellar hook-associated protein 2
VPTITFGGINSGLPANLVDQLIEAEKQPIKVLQGKKEKIEGKMKLVGELEEKLHAVENSLSSLASVKGFNDIKLESGDVNIINGQAEVTAPKGTWNIEVESLAQKASAVTNGFPDKDKTQIGTGYFKFNTPDGEKEVFLNDKNNTLEGAANTINNAGIGVKAAVINDRKDKDNPYKLMLSGDGMGDDKQVEYPTLYFLDGDQDLYFDRNTAAKNGVIKVDGFEFEVANNTVTDVIPGVTLDLRQAAPGRQVALTVKENREAVSGKIDGFVKAMNDVMGFIQTQNHLDEKTDTTKTLGGDQLIRSVESRITQLIQQSQYGVNSRITRLSELGVEITRNGTLKLNEDKFNATLAREPDEVRKFFSGDGFNTGFVSSIRREISTMTNTAFGTISNRKKALQDESSRIDQNIETKERQLGRREEQLRRQFANLEETMGRLKQQGAAVANMSAQGPSLNLSGGEMHG